MNPKHLNILRIRTEPFIKEFYYVLRFDLILSAIMLFVGILIGSSLQDYFILLVFLLIIALYLLISVSVNYRIANLCFRDRRAKNIVKAQGKITHVGNDFTIQVWRYKSNSEASQSGKNLSHYVFKIADTTGRKFRIRLIIPHYYNNSLQTLKDVEMTFYFSQYAKILLECRYNNVLNANEEKTEIFKAIQRINRIKF